MIKVYFHQSADDALFKYAVIIAKSKGQWVFCRHRDRTTYENPGGHREPNEAIDQTAKRELWEETGAEKYTIERICPYSVDDGKETTYGMLYFANIEKFGPLPETEIAEVKLFTEKPENWTYPKIQPHLVDKAEEWLKGKELQI